MFKANYLFQHGSIFFTHGYSPTLVDVAASAVPEDHGDETVATI